MEMWANRLLQNCQWKILEQAAHLFKTNHSGKTQVSLPIKLGRMDSGMRKRRN